MADTEQRDAEDQTVTVVGIGGMGAPVARNLLAAGYAVSVWNRSPERLSPLTDAGASAVEDPLGLFRQGPVLSLLADDAAFREVFDDAVLEAAPDGAVHVNLATVSPELARQEERRHSRYGIAYLAAPVFGRVEVAEAGRLNVVAAGEPSALSRALPLLEAISTRVWAVGDDPATANIVKVAGNAMIASAIQSLAEAVSLGERSGLPAERLVEILTSTVFPGPVYSSYGALMAEGSYEPAGFTTTLGRKDVDLARRAAADAGLRLPVADVVSELLGEAIGAGRGRQDWASLAEEQRVRG